MAEDKKSKILTGALAVFLRYGFRRVNMNDLAEAAGMSRPALYVLFKNKEEIFLGVILRWMDEAISAVDVVMAGADTPGEKIERAFDVWVVRPFEITTGSPEARELVECTFGFAQATLKQGYARFEVTITPVLASLAETFPHHTGIAPDRIAHILANAVRGFKQVATTPDELRQLISELLQLVLGRDQGHKVSARKAPKHTV